MRMRKIDSGKKVGFYLTASVAGFNIGQGNHNNM